MSDEPVRSFQDVGVDDLEAMSTEALDRLPFGVIGFAPDTTVTHYNATESRLAGLPADSVLGEAYFQNVAQCMNNFMVAQRFEDEPELDATLDYVLTLRMRPTPVKLRLLKTPTTTTSFILVQR